MCSPAQGQARKDASAPLATVSAVPRVARDPKMPPSTLVGVCYVRATALLGEIKRVLWSGVTIPSKSQSQSKEWKSGEAISQLFLLGGFDQNRETEPSNSHKIKSPLDSEAQLHRKIMLKFRSNSSGNFMYPPGKS